MGSPELRQLTLDERARLPLVRDEMSAAGVRGQSTPFTFFAAFDGTNNHEGNLKLSGDPETTNASRPGSSRPARQAAENPNIEVRYYPGVGTGGDQGGLVNAAFLPSSAVNAAAERAYTDFRRAALDHLDTPGATIADIGAATTGFSRGCATAIRFAQLVNDRGLVDAEAA